MGYRDSDDSNFSHHGMGRDADDTRLGERSNHQGYSSDDQRSGTGGYRREFETRGARYDQERSGQERYGQQGYGQYGMSRDSGNFRSESQGYPSPISRDWGGSYGSQSRSAYNQDADQQPHAWSAPFDNQGFRDQGRFTSSYRDGDREQGGNAYGFIRGSMPAQQSQGYRDPDYQQWRDEQLRMLDDDYDTWRKERYQKFSDDFSQWRTTRNTGSSGQQQGQQNQKNSGSNTAPGSGASGSQGNTQKSNDAT